LPNVTAGFHSAAASRYLQDDVAFLARFRERQLLRADMSPFGFAHAVPIKQKPRSLRFEVPALAFCADQNL
jgi:hypothetical protein